MTLENAHIYVVVGSNLDTSDIISLHDSYADAKDAAHKETDTNEDWCLIKIERLV